MTSAFWREQSQRFLSLRGVVSQKPTILLGASYLADGWGFDDVPGFAGRSADRWLLDHGKQDVMEEFKGVAGICAVALGAANTDQAWAAWLDCLRRDRVGLTVAELQIASWLQQPRPDPDFEVTAVGLVAPVQEIWPDADRTMITSEILEIDDVCGASDSVCRRLADESFKTELAESTAVPVTQPSTAIRPAPDGSPALTVTRAAKALGYSVDTLHRMRDRGEIQMIRPGRHWRVLASEVRRLREHPKFKDRVR